MKQVARFEQRRVERLAVEADERAGARELARPPTRAAPARRRSRVSRNCRVTNAPSASNHAAADEKRERAGAAAQTGRLEVEEDERRPRGRAAGEQRRPRRDAAIEPRCHRADLARGHAGRRRLPSAIDDEASPTASCRRATRQIAASAAQCGRSRESASRGVRQSRAARRLARARHDAANAIGQRAQNGCDLRLADVGRVGESRRRLLQQIENPQRRDLCQRTGVADRPDTARDIRSRTRTRRSAGACRRAARACIPNSGALKPMPPGIVVVDEDPLRSGGRHRPPPLRRCRSRCRCRGRRTSAAAARPASARTPARRRRRGDRRTRTAARPSPSAGIVSQYDVVCICCSGRSSSPEPTFSFV